MDNVLKLPCDVGEISDGYHTFNELYEHRYILFMYVVKAHKNQAFKTWLNDKKEKWEGWFILGINTEHGQITYHLPDIWWHHCKVKEIECNNNYDGHSAHDTLERLLLLLG